MQKFKKIKSKIKTTIKQIVTISIACFRIYHTYQFEIAQKTREEWSR